MRVIMKDMKDDTTSVYDMLDGDLAVIAKWGNDEPNSDIIGSVMQRHGSTLVAIGMPSGKSYGTMFDGSRSPDIRVKLLRPGDTMVISQRRL